MGALAVLSACGSSGDPRPATWPYVSAAILTPNCATVSCHSRATAISGLDFSSPERGYISLTGLWSWIVDPSKTPSDLNGCRAINGTIVCQSNHRGLIVPCDSQQSRLVQMIHAYGNAPRMPPDRPLPEADVRLIEKWIANGAVEGPREPDGGAGTVCLQVDGDRDGGDAGASDTGPDALGEDGSPADNDDGSDATADAIDAATADASAGPG